jgi:hypothetical protein
MNPVFAALLIVVATFVGPLAVAKIRKVDWLLEMVKIEIGMAVRCVLSVLGSPCAIYFAGRAWWKALFWTQRDIERLRERSASADA